MKALIFDPKEKNEFTRVLIECDEQGFYIDDPVAFKECRGLMEAGDKVVFYTHDRFLSCVAYQYFDEEIDEILSKMTGETFEVFETVDQFIEGIKNAKF